MKLVLLEKIRVDRRGLRLKIKGKIESKNLERETESKYSYWA